MEITLSVSRKSVFDEVAQKSGYTGAKMIEPEGVNGAYDRIQTVDEDAPELEKLWDEASMDLSVSLSGILSEEGFDEDGDTYRVTMRVNDTFNSGLLRSLNIGLYNYFVYGVLYRWYLFANKEESAAYADMAGAMLGTLKSSTMKRVFTRKMNPF